MTHCINILACLLNTLQSNQHGESQNQRLNCSEIVPCRVDFLDISLLQVRCVYPGLDRVQIQLVVSESRSYGV